MATLAANTKTDLIQLNYPQTIRVVDYKESLVRLRRLIGLINAKIASGDARLVGQSFKLLKVFELALQAQARIVDALNDDHISCPIVWDELTGFPSHPTLAADLNKYVEILQSSDEVLVAILRSFSGWTFLAKETSPRCFGSFFGLKNVQMNIKINHILSSVDGRLGLKQLVGVDSPNLNQKELERYFGCGRSSQVIDDLFIIFDRRWLTREAGGVLEVSELKTEKTPLFNLEKFEAMIDSRIIE